MSTQSWSRFLVRVGQCAAFVAMFGLGALACAPTPRNVPCSNDGQCEELSEDFNYCLQSRCVECVASASCGDGNTCVDGRCLVKCRDSRACPDQEACVDGVCGPL